MAYPAKKLTKIHNFLLLPSITRVSWQRIKRAWPLLGVIWLAMLMLITLVCVEPLFARVTTFALFQNLARSSQGGPFFPAVASSRKPTSEQIQQAEASFTQQIQTGLGDYVGNGSTVVLKTPDLQVLPSPGGTTVYHSGGRSHAASGGPQGDITQGAVLSISGYDIPQIASRIRVVKGRLPDPAASQLEAAISEKTALDLKLQVGSDIKVRYPASAGLVVWQLHVVGLIHIESSSDDFWHTLIDTGEGNLNAYNGDGKVLYNTSLEYNALVPRSTLLTETSKIDSTDQFVGFTLAWNYPVNLDRLNANSLGSFLERYRTLQILQSTHIDNLNSIWLGPSDFVSGLYRLQNMLIFGQIIAYILLCLTMGMALLMTGIMSYVLIERQMPTIAAMRSRGASRSYVVGTFAAQGTLLVLLAMLIGPLLAFLLTRFLTMNLLSAENQSALDFFTQNFSRVWLEVRGLVLVAGILAFVTMLVAVYRATKIDITLLRRETARATRAPFWRRFYLDIILAVLVSLGYALYIYTFLSPLANNARVQILQTLFSFIAVPLILIAIVLLFLRIMPWLFHLATRIVSRTSSTVALLAFAQIERSPRASARLILLLALALASSAYLLNLADTQLQWYPDQANFRVGADFKGPIDTAYIDKSFAQLMQHYSTLAGVRSVTLGYEQARFESPTSAPIPPISLDAVDADTYVNTGLWSPDYSHQPLTDLMQQLKAHRTDASTQNIVYVIVDTNAWNVLSLSSGTEFTLPMPGYMDGKGMHFKVLERINNIPGMYDNLNNSYSGLGLLVDYQSYSTVYAKDNPKQTIKPNTVWLSTADDSATLTRIHQAEPLLMDRRALLDAARVDPAHVNIMSILGIGIAVALCLALLGTLIVSWVSIASRRVNFAALSALGMPAGQLTAILILEHAIVYILAFLLALGLGWLFSFNVLPVFNMINSLIYGGSSTGNSSVPPLHVHFPIGTAILLVGTLLVINAVALVLIASTNSRSVKSRMLRLNED